MIGDNEGYINTDIMYENLMNRFSWGNAEDPSVYLDETNRRMFSNYRRMFGTLALALLSEGDTTRAMEVCRRGISLVPESSMPYDYFMTDITSALIRAGETEEGTELLETVISYSLGYLEYIAALPPSSRFGLEYPIGINMQAAIQIFHLTSDLGLEEIHNRIDPIVNRYYQELVVNAN
jgi:hypothetical protein